MTEAEAATKWCPMVRAAHMDHPAGLNRGNIARGEDIEPYNAKCIGSACMMWRWEAGGSRESCQAADQIHVTELEAEGWICEGDGWCTRPWPDSRQGYCGLAGRP